MAEPLRILGIDPGTASVGYGLVDFSGKNCFNLIASGVIRTHKDQPSGQRLKIIRQDLIELINEFAPDVASVEALFFFKNAKTVIPVAQARGVILETAASAGLDAYEYTPMQVKLNLTGFGRADKTEIQQIVARILGHDEIIKPDDAADAVAIAICHARLHVSIQTIPPPSSRPAAK